MNHSLVNYYNNIRSFPTCPYFVEKLSKVSQTVFLRVKFQKFGILYHRYMEMALTEELRVRKNNINLIIN